MRGIKGALPPDRAGKSPPPSVTRALLMQCCVKILYSDFNYICVRSFVRSGAPASQLKSMNYVKAPKRRVALFDGIATESPRRSERQGTVRTRKKPAVS
jgi:hypothetical protein